MKRDVDYSLYLVTDSTPAILGNRDICDVVEAAVKGGVSCVQYRDKTSETAVLVDVARRLQKITQRHNVPLLINDRIDVALAIGCEGVHIGQDDMDLSIARRLLGPDAVIGVTVSNVDEALKACAGGADYLGIGTVYATPTKTNTKSIIGTAGVREVLGAVATAGYDKVRTVCIGGVNGSNLQRIVFQSASVSRPLDGVAVVSALMAAQDPEAEARRLLGLVKKSSAFRLIAPENRVADPDTIITQVPPVLQAVHTKTPLSHNMTNLVVQNFAANVALAVGASPIMANYGEEARDLAKLGGALVINMGTVTPEGLENYVKALKAYNEAGRPVVFDPVGAGATSVRRAAVRTILANGYLDVIKGNEGEIRTVFGEDKGVQQRGVDSSSTLTTAQKAELVRQLAAREKNIVLMTGATDFVSDGVRTLRINNGHEYLGSITGTGCVLGTTVSAMLAAVVNVEPPSSSTGGAAPSIPDRLVAVVAGLLHFEIASELAAGRADVQGPGTFVPAFIDELARIRKATDQGDLGWLQRAKISLV